jgi:hypothetical protein
MRSLSSGPFISLQRLPEALAPPATYRFSLYRATTLAHTPL